jgi:hypothetical protein
MRLKAKLIAPIVLFSPFTSDNHLFNQLEIASTVERLSKEFILRLTPEKIHFIVSHRGLDSSVQLWGQISAVPCEILTFKALMSAGGAV